MTYNYGGKQKVDTFETGLNHLILWGLFSVFFYHKQAFVTKKRKIVYLSALTDVLFQTTPPQTGSMEQAQAQAKLETPAFGEGAGMVGREK